MSMANRRSKDPEAVKSALLNATVSLSLEGGISAVTTQSVCQMAGVSKGALTHHYASKQALLDSVFDDLLARFESEVLSLLSEHSLTEGAFTKAYVEVCFNILEDKSLRPLAALSTLLIGDKGCRKRWQDWSERMLSHYEVTDSAIHCQMARLAADGAWYNSLIHNSTVNYTAVKAEILQLLSQSQNK